MAQFFTEAELSARLADDRLVIHHAAISLFGFGAFQVPPHPLSLQSPPLVFLGVFLHLSRKGLPFSRKNEVNGLDASPGLYWPPLEPERSLFCNKKRVFSRICVQILAFGADFQPPKKKKRKKEGKFKNFPQRHPPTGESVRLDCAYRRAAKGRRRKGFPSWAGNAPAHSITDNLTHRLFCAYGAVSKEKARQGRVSRKITFSA